MQFERWHASTVSDALIIFQRSIIIWSINFVASIPDRYWFSIPARLHSTNCIIRAYVFFCLRSALFLNWKLSVRNDVPMRMKWRVHGYMMTASNGNIFRVTGPCAGNSLVTGEFPSQTPLTWSFDVLFDLRLNKRLSKQLWGRWFKTPSRPIWRHCNVTEAVSRASAQLQMRIESICLFLGLILTLFLRNCKIIC